MISIGKRTATQLISFILYFSSGVVSAASIDTFESISANSITLGDSVSVTLSASFITEPGYVLVPGTFHWSTAINWHDSSADSVVTDSSSEPVSHVYSSPGTFSPYVYVFSWNAEIYNPSYANPIDLYVSGSSTPMQAMRVDVTAAIPEPETYAMLLAGLGLLGWHGRRRKLKLAA